MISPLKLGHITFPSNLIQGPLAGFTCAPMRIQTWKFSQPAYTSTEMVSASHLIHAKKFPRRYLERDPDEGPLCFQLSGSNPEHLARATQIVNEMQVEVIELNCGCPVKKIRSKQAGSKLLADPDRLGQIIKKIRENTDAVLSVKIRVTGDNNDQDDFINAQVIEDAGADCLVVHGRHWTERYDVPCRYPQIKRLVNAVKIPVIGNGDINDLPSLKKMFHETGCSGVMIARAVMGQPWLFHQLTNEALDKPFDTPTPQVIATTFLDHIQRLAQLDSPHRAILQARKMGKYYTRDHIPQAKSFLAELMECTSLENFQQLIHDYWSL